MAAEIFNIAPNGFTYQSYSIQDDSLITSELQPVSFTTSSYIESLIYDLNKNLYYINYNFNNYTVLNNGQSAGTNSINDIIIDPENFLIINGFTQGEYVTYFNFLTREIGQFGQTLFILEISSLCEHPFTYKIILMIVNKWVSFT